MYPPDKQHHQLLTTLIYSFVPITAIAIVVAVAFWCWRKHRMGYHEQIPFEEPSPLMPPSPILGQRPVQLMEIKARGRFGAVWKAQFLTEYVAVKIFPLQDKSSWKTEQDIYQLPLMKHENILRFIAVEKRGDNLNTELWLITEFHENGSLYDFLKGNILTYAEVLKIAETMCRGLAYLHDDIPGVKGMDGKPAIAHRDFKSKNVLIRKDLSACVADFGLAIKFEPGKGPGDTHGQVNEVEIKFKILKNKYLTHSRYCEN